MVTITKRYDDYPAAHRQHKHNGHCRFIHGHNWSFEITFAAEELDENGFVVDFGGLYWVKEFLTKNFDHTLLLNGDDPELDRIRREFSDLMQVVLVINCGCEGIARMLYKWLNVEIRRHEYPNKPRITKVTVFEDSKNSATYYE